MSSRKAQLAGLSLCVSVLLSGTAAAQAAGDVARTMTVTGTHGQANYTLRISVTGKYGRVEVHDAGGMVQTLSCPLLRDEGDSPDPLALTTVAEVFVRGFEAADLDLDGYMDVRGVREFGAKWERYCVWLFDPQGHRFERSSLAEQMELLSNLQVDPKRRRIISYSIGPVDPLWDEYRIEGVGQDRPYWPRLVPVQSCFIRTDPQGETSVAVGTYYERDRTAVVRRALRSDDMGRMPEPCGETFSKPEKGR